MAFDSYGVMSFKHIYWFLRAIDYCVKLKESEGVFKKWIGAELKKKFMKS